MPVRFCALLLIGLFLPTSSTAATFTWGGSDGSWSNQFNWLPAGVPGVDDRVVINTGTITVDGDRTIRALTLNGGRIAGANSLTVVEDVAWETGELAVFFTLLAGATMNIDYPGDLADSPLISGAFNNFGAIDHVNGQLRLAAGVDFNNQGSYDLDGGILNMGPNTNFFNFTRVNAIGPGTVIVGLANSTFYNETGGRFTSAAGTGEQRIQPNFTNAGEVRQQSGTGLTFFNTFTNSGTLFVPSLSLLTMETAILDAPIFIRPENSFLVDSLFLTAAWQTDGRITINDYYQAADFLPDSQGEFIIDGDLRVDSVQLDGDLTIAPGGRMSLFDSVTLRGELRNENLLSQQSGSAFSVEGSGLIINSGSHTLSNCVVDLQASAGYENQDGVLSLIGIGRVFPEAARLPMTGPFWCAAFPAKW